MAHFSDTLFVASNHGVNKHLSLVQLHHPTVERIHRRLTQKIHSGLNVHSQSGVPTFRKVSQYLRHFYAKSLEKNYKYGSEKLTTSQIYSYVGCSNDSYIVTDGGQTEDRRTDHMMMPIADHTV